MGGNFQKSREKAIKEIRWKFGMFIAYHLDDELEPLDLTGITYRRDRLAYAIEYAQLFGLITAAERAEFEDACNLLIDEIATDCGYGEYVEEGLLAI